MNSSVGADLIRCQTGRNCSRQNLEKLCKTGRLPKSCVSLSPIRLLRSTLVAEYLEMVDPCQSNAIQPRALRPPDQPRSSDQPPDYNESRARHEFEKANLAELDRKQKEALLLPRDQVEKVWANAVTIARTKLLAVPTRTRQRIPHLTLEEVAIVEELIRESLQELAEGTSDGE